MTTNNATNTSNPITVAQGGTGDASFTAYAVLCGGTTSTSALQNVSGVGTSAQVLTSNGASALPTWQAAGGGGAGSVINTLSTTTTTRISTTNTTMTDATGLSISITPTSSSSKILVSGHITMGGTTGNCNLFQIVRASTAICIGTGATGAQLNVTGALGATNGENSTTIGFNFLDSPSTTSSTTYKIQYMTSNGSNAAVINQSSENLSAIYDSVGTSTITVMEIHG